MTPAGGARRWRRAATFAAALLHAGVTGAVSMDAGQAPAPHAGPAIGGLPASRTGEDIYRAACASCHGLDGRGMPRASVGFDVPFPDFSDCGFATAEPDPDWQAVVHRGGRVRGLDRRMPAFGAALTADDIASVVGYIRTFCADRAKWPPGDLNFPRAFFTEKAFPENETVWVTGFNPRGTTAVSTDFIYERRFGPRNQVEILVPVEFGRTPGGGWVKGVGDVALAFKRAFHSSMATGSIAAAGAEVILPSGNAALGLGKGYTVYEPFAMFGQVLPRDAFLQLHGGLELPSGGAAGTKEAFFRTAVGRTFAGDQGFGRAWTPQVEVLWARPFGGNAEWDVLPQVQVSLSKMQHVLIAGGVRVPVNRRQGRQTTVVLYALWDWADGGLFQFWK